MRARTDLAGRTAVITGGAGYLGRSHGRALAGSGAHVVLADVDAQAAASAAEELRDSAGIECIGLGCDVSDGSSVREVVDAVVDRFGGIDALVNNAAIDPKFESDDIGRHSSRFEHFPLDEWHRSLDVNITGMFLCAQAALPHLRERRGVVVNIASTYGIVGPDQRLYEREGQPPQFKPVTYSVTKAAVIGFTRYLATYLAGSGVRVNTLSPGGVRADHDDEFVERYSSRTVLGRMARPQEISDALLFLVSDDSTYMTGANLVVDGGWTAW